MAETVLSILARFRGEGAAKGVDDLKAKLNELGTGATGASAQASASLAKLNTDAVAASKSLGSAYDVEFVSQAGPINETAQAVTDLGTQAQATSQELTTMFEPVAEAAAEMTAEVTTQYKVLSDNVAKSSQDMAREMIDGIESQIKAEREAATQHVKTAAAQTETAANTTKAAKKSKADTEETTKAVKAQSAEAEKLGMNWKKIAVGLGLSASATIGIVRFLKDSIGSAVEADERLASSVASINSSWAGFKQAAGAGLIELAGGADRLKAGIDGINESLRAFSHEKIELTFGEKTEFFLKYAMGQATGTVLTGGVITRAGERADADPVIQGRRRSRAALAEMGEEERAALDLDRLGRRSSNTATGLGRDIAPLIDAEKGLTAELGRLIDGMASGDLPGTARDVLVDANQPAQPRSREDFGRNAEAEVARQEQEARQADLDRLMEIEAHQERARQQADELGHAITYGLANGIRQAKTLGDVLDSALQSVMDNLLNRGADAAGDWLGNVISKIGGSGVANAPKSASGGGSSRPSMRESTTPQSAGGVRTLVIPLMVGGREMARVLIPDLDQAYARGQAG
ncbi:MAG: hypothetical protein WC683_09885 [bacterium]